MPIWLHMTCGTYSTQQVHGKMLSIEHYFSAISYLDIFNMMGFKINEGSINHWDSILNLGFLSAIPQILKEFLKQKDVKIHAISGNIRCGIFLKLKKIQSNYTCLKLNV